MELLAEILLACFLIELYVSIDISVAITAITIRSSIKKFHQSEAVYGQ